MSVHDVRVYTWTEASFLGILKDQRRRIVQNLPWRDSPHSTQRGIGVHLTDANPFDNLSVLDVQVPGFPWCLASWYAMSFGWKPLKLCKLQNAIDVVSTSVKSHPAPKDLILSATMDNGEIPMCKMSQSLSPSKGSCRVWLCHNPYHQVLYIYICRAPPEKDWNLKQPNILLTAHNWGTRSGDVGSIDVVDIVQQGSPNQPSTMNNLTPSRDFKKKYMTCLGTKKACGKRWEEQCKLTV